MASSPQQPIALPRSQLFPMQTMKPSEKAGAKTTTRVLLRVKRRRPSPTAAAASTSTSTQSSTNTNAADNAVGGIGPDRIQLALPCMSAPEGSCNSKKRRKIGKREEMALIQRLDSAVSIHDNEPAKKDDILATEDNNAVFHTPSRRGAGAGNNPYDPSNDMLADGQRTPPPSNTTTIKATNNNNDDNTPAPPTKPKRTVIFRKITDLQKRLDPSIPINNEPSGNETLRLFDPPPPENNINNNNNALAGAATLETGGGEWSNGNDEKSKWLRIVDVMLKEDDQVSSICSSIHENNDDGAISTAEDGIMGSGQRVRRMRPRPADLATDNDDTVEGGENNNATNTNNNSGGGRKKRRKLGWIVEQSRTVLESDFWNNQGQTTITAANTGSTSNNTSNNDKLDPELLRLIEYSLSALHQYQGGGSVMPHLAYLKNDPRLTFCANTPQGRLMVNHTLYSSSSNQTEEWKGRTVLHIAALWGDLVGVRSALEMGADPTIFDAQGSTPVGLARKGNHGEVVTALMEGEKKAVADKNIRSDGGDEEYYYEVYCMETTTDNSEPGKVSSSSDEGGRKSPFLRTRNDAAAGDSIPDLERSSVLSEDDDDTNSSGANTRGCALIELQKGFGYWNERGELILEPAAGDNAPGGGGDAANADDTRFVQRFYHDGKLDKENDSIMGDDDGEHDSNNEGYDGNDYPDDDVSFGMDSDYEDYRDADAYGEAGSGSEDDDSVDNWKLNFRNRFVSKIALNQFDYGGEDECAAAGAISGSGDME